MAHTVTFTVDELGKLEYHIEGIKGTACDDIVARITEIAGAPSAVRMTDEYRERPVTIQKIGRISR